MKSDPKVTCRNIGSYSGVTTNCFITEIKNEMYYGGSSYPINFLLRGSTEVDAASLFEQLEWIRNTYLQVGSCIDDCEYVQTMRKRDYLHIRLEPKYPKFEWVGDMDIIRYRFEALMHTDGTDFIDYLSEKLHKQKELSEEEIEHRWADMMYWHKLDHQSSGDEDTDDALDEDETYSSDYDD